MRVNKAHFQAFFSYSHDDEEISPTLVEQLTVDFQRDVQGALVNCGFTVFKDKSGLRTGDRIQAAILAQLRASDLLLILLTPNWLSSDYCRDEYHEYVKLEAVRNRGPTIVVVIPTDLTAEREYFDAEQEGIARDLLDRLAFSAQGKNATPSGAMKAAARRSLVQDTRTIIARLRS
ncbi:MAG: hypothetical protein K0R83_759, partial [Caulobacter sp.]|nr:hypothetical protein [Caulobacter sp.]